MGLFAALALWMTVCRPVPGEEQLWSGQTTRYVIVGEVHGTTQVPELFGDLACAAHASGRPVVVGVEMSETAQPDLDRFLGSDGRTAAVRAFLASPAWRSPMKDGRSSRSYLQLIERLRVLKRAGEIAAVVAIQPSGDTAEQPSADGFNAAMADRIRSAGKLSPRAIVLVLVGNLHASKHPVHFGDQVITPAAADLPPAETISVNVETGGKAWNCSGPSTCGVHDLIGVPPRKREVRLDRSVEGNYDGVVDLGIPATASLPAVK